jgi:hypothetical protein
MSLRNIVSGGPVMIDPGANTDTASPLHADLKETRLTDFTIYTEAALYAELAGRESMRGIHGMAAKLNDREISKLRLELESRNLPIEQPGGPRSGTFYVLSRRDPPFNVGVLHADPHCSLIDEHAAEAKRPAEVRVATPDEISRQPGCKICTARA